MRLGKTTGMVSLALVFALIAVALTGCSSASNASKTPQYDLAQDGVLTVASSLDYPPFEYLDGETPTGFSIAMIQEVANRLGLACSVQKVPFDGILSSISEGGTYDVGVSSITITAKRSEQVAFSDLYYIADLAVVTRGGAYVSVADLKGKPVAARHATTGVDYVRDKMSGTVVEFDDPRACFAALRAGSVEAVVIDLPYAQKMLAGDYADCTILEWVASCETYGIALNKKNTELQAAINDALSQMESDGTMVRLRTEYLGR